jgi:sugar lactone lactonase YvrE
LSKTKLNGLDATALQRLHRFLRLKTKTGWSIDDLDKTIRALASADIDDGLLVKLAFVARLQKSLNLPVSQLASFWSAVDVTGRDALYLDLFQNKTVLSPVDPAFSLSYSSPLAALPAGVTAATLAAVTSNISYAAGAFQFTGQMTEDQKTQFLSLPTSSTDPNLAAYQLAIDNLFQARTSSGLALASTDPNAKISLHVPAMLAALRLSGTDFAAMVANEKLADVLDLPTLSAYCRFAALARALKISVTDLNTLEKLSGANVVSPNDPASLSAFVDKAQKVLRSPYSAAQLNYLYCNVNDPNQGIAPLDGNVVLFLTGLQNALNKITDGSSAVPDPPAGLAAALQQQLAAVLDAAGVTETMGLLDGTFQFSASLAALPAGVTLPAGITYSAAKLVSQGPISDLTRQNLKALSNDAAYATAVDALYQQPVSFIGLSLSLFLNPTDAVSQLINNPALATADKQKYVLARLLARTNAIAQFLSGQLGIDASIVALLLGTLLKSASGTGNAIRDFLALAPPYPASAAWTSYQLLFKAALLIKGFRMSAKEIGYVSANSSDFANFDFNALPVGASQPASPQLTALFAQWLRLCDLFTLRNGVADGEALLDVFEAAAHLTGPAPTPASLATQLAAAAGWDGSETSILASPAGFNLAVGDFKNEVKLLPLLMCWNLSQRAGVSAARLFHWAGDPFDSTLANANEIKSSARAKYDDQTWLTAGRVPINRLRDKQRTALVAFSQNALQFADAGRLFDHFLIDVEMSSCMMTSRIVQAVDSVQLFVQRCLMNLESNPDANNKETGVASSAIDSDQWQKWRKYYRVWEANRQVFLYPENWIEPELRDNKSPFFQDLENELLQNDVNAQTVEDAFGNYLQKVDEVSRLEIVGSYHDDDADVLHIFGRTFHTPATYYYRQYANGVWTAWENVPLDIQGDDLIPIVYERRLYLFWPIITTKAQQNSNPGSNSSPLKHCEIQLAWGRYQNGKWSAKQLSQDILLCPSRQGPMGKLPLDVPDGQLPNTISFSFRGVLNDLGTNKQRLAIQAYVEQAPVSRPPEGSPPVAASSASIKVRVVLETGGPCVGVTVWVQNLFGSGSTPVVETTGVGGAATFGGLSSVVFGVGAYAAGVYVPQEYWNVTDEYALLFLTGNSQYTVTFTLRPRGTGDYFVFGEFDLDPCSGAVTPAYLSDGVALPLPAGTHHDGMMLAESLDPKSLTPIGYLDLLTQARSNVTVLGATPSLFRLLPPHQLSNFVIPPPVTSSASAIGPAAALPRLAAPATTPEYNVNPTFVTFMGQPVGTSSPAQAVTLTEAGASGGNPTITITGPNAADFSQSNTCAKYMGPGEGCAINVVFTPTAAGIRTSNLTFGGPGVTPQTLPLTGYGMQLNLGCSAQSVSFGSQAIGATSAPQSVQLSNAQTYSLFAYPGNPAVDSAGNIYVPAGACNTIRKIAPDGAVTTLAGAAGQVGTANGSGAAARFNGPGGVAVDASGNVYVADTYNHTIRMITPAGVVTTLAGTAGQTGSTDGPVATATFNQPMGVAIDGAGNIYVADYNNDTIRKISAGMVSTFAGTAGAVGSTDATGPAARFYNPTDLALDSAGNIYVADAGGDTIRKITPGAVVTTLAGTYRQIGSTDAKGPAARFSNPMSLAVDGAGNVYVADTANSTIRKIAPDGTVTTLAGAAGQTGSVDGPALSSRFRIPVGVALDAVGNIYVSDSTNCTIRKITSAGIVSTIAGMVGIPGCTDTTGAPINISNLAASGDFAVVHPMLGALPTGQTRDVQITFAPTAAGTRTGQLTITDSATGSPTTVSLSGTGVLPTVTVSTQSLDFGDQPAGIASASQPVTLTNNGAVPVTISSVVLAGPNAADFKPDQLCSGALQPNTSCTMNIVFNPPAEGGRIATLTIADNTSGSPHVVSLAGNGVVTLALSTPAVNFTSQTVGTTSLIQTVKLTNTSNVNVGIANVAIVGANAGDFAVPNPFVGTLQPKADCTMNITFTPTAGGSRSAVLGITDNAGGSPQTVALNGTGFVPGVALYPPSLTFAGQPVNTTSPPQSVTFTNAGSSPVNITSITATGDFAETNNYAGVVMPSASCTINVTFSPSAAGTRAGSLIIQDTSAGSPHTVSLSGVGTQSAVSLTPASMIFSAPSVGVPSAAQTVTLANTGTAPLKITSISLTGANPTDFFFTSDGANPLAPGQSSSIALVFAPSAGGNRSAQLTIVDDASGSPHAVNLTGNITGPELSVSPAFLTFAELAPGSVSAPQTVTLTNTGSGPLAISSITASGDFAETGSYPNPLPGGASCSISVTFKPMGDGARTGTLIIVDSAPGSPHTVRLTGSGLYAESFEFFYQDSKRTYFVTLPQSPPADPATPQIQFFNHFHPYICSFIEAFNRDGIPGLLTLANQHLTDPIAPNITFQTEYSPTVVVAPPYPRENVDFSYGGAYDLYNWELFFHAPMLVAGQLATNQKFQDAQQWYHYIFNPTLPNAWQTLPFQTTTKENIEDLLRLLEYTGSDPSIIQQRNNLENQLSAWTNDPFNPHAIARLRLIAYQKNVVMKYLDNLIAWGDQLFRQYTMETVNQATQLYVMAQEILGPRPQLVSSRQSAQNQTYNDLAPKLDDFSNVLVQLENDFPLSVGPASNSGSSGLGLTGAFYFCIPNNAQLLAYWDTVADRLFKIRHCQNIDGVVIPLPLFPPPISPGLLVRAAAQGVDLASSLNDVEAATPYYRFTYMLQKAFELCSEVRAFGNSLLTALEKNDGEQLALLRAIQETALLNSVLKEKQLQLDEANTNVEALQKSRLVTQARYDFYANIPFLIPEETTHLALTATSGVFQAVAQLMQVTASAVAPFPDFSFGVAGAFGSPVALIHDGATNAASGSSNAAKGFEVYASLLNTLGSMSATMGGYRRRASEWQLQADVAQKELDQIDQQIAAAQTRSKIAQAEIDNQNIQIANSQAVEDFLRSKYTNQDLYSWMVSQTSSVFFQCYQLAYDMAKRAEKAFRFERGLTDSSFIAFGYWDNLKRGLLSGEQLYLDLKRMETAYLDQNKRDYEISKHVSLVLTAPAALIALKETGQCAVDLPEALFDADYPGHFMRRLKSVSLTIPCVTGPYTSVNCTLTLIKSKVRVSTDTQPAYPEQVSGNAADPRFAYNFAATQSIATSTGQNDSGMFEVTFRDERYLPFEGAGAISTWQIDLPQDTNAFDFETISDVILNLNYTARDGGNALRQAARTAATILPPAPVPRLFSLKHEFPTEWYKFAAPPSTAASQTLALSLSIDRFPYTYRGKSIKITKLDLYLRFKEIYDPAVYNPTPFGDYAKGTPLTMYITADLTSAAPLAATLGSTASDLNGLPHAAVDLSSQPGSLGAWLLEARDADVNKIAASLQTKVTANNTTHYRINVDLIDDVILVCTYKAQ